LFPVDLVEKAMHRHLQKHEYDFSQKRLGIDVARFGDDRTVIYPRQGLACFNSVQMRGARVPEILGRTALAINKWQSDLEFVDGTGGFGSGIVDGLRQLGRTPYEIHASFTASDSRYFNIRSESAFRACEWMKHGSLPYSDSLLQEFTTIEYSFKNSKFILEPKDLIKKKLGRSPDEADAFFLTHAIPDLPKSEEMKRLYKFQSQHQNTDYDPYAEEKFN
jgi:hypothetical protein